MAAAAMQPLAAHHLAGGWPGSRRAAWPRDDRPSPPPWSAPRAAAAGATTPVESGWPCSAGRSTTFVAKRDELAAEITWQMGRPIAQSPGEIRGFEERARYMLEARPSAGRSSARAQAAGFTRFIRASPWGSSSSSPLELPLPHRGQQRRPGARRRQRRAAQALGADAACAPSGSRRRSTPAGLPAGRLPAPAHGPRRRLAPGRQRRRSSSPSPARCPPATPSRPRPAGRSSPPTSSSAARTRPTSARTPTSPTRSRTWSTAPASTPARAAAASSGSTCTRGGSTPSSTATPSWPRSTSSATRPSRRPHSARWSARRGRLRARPGRRGRGRRVPAPSIDRRRFAREARGRLHGAAVLVDVTHAMRVMREESFAPIVGIMPVAGDDEAVALMNDSRLRPDRLGLDPRRGGGGPRSARGSRPAPGS